MRRVLVVVAATLSISSLALASGADMRKSADASVDRNILFPTAETVNAGDILFNDYEIFVAGLTYGITDDLAVSANTLIPAFGEFPFLLLLSGKYRLIAQENLILSVQPNATFSSVEGIFSGGFGFQLLCDVILDSEGDVVLSFAESNQFFFADIGGTASIAEGMVFFLGAGLNWRIAEIVKIMVEFSLPAAWAWSIGEFEIFEEALLFNYGVRFFGETLAVDLTFLRPLHPDVGGDVTDVLPMGIPYIAFSARF